MNLRVTAKWVALALVGLAIAIGVAIAAANLTSQQIGIASESVSAGDTLAPSLRTPEEEREEAKHAGHEKPEPGGETSPATPNEPTTPEEEVTPPREPNEETNPPAESHGDDYGRGGGGGGDD